MSFSNLIVCNTILFSTNKAESFSLILQDSICSVRVFTSPLNYADIFIQSNS